VEETVNLSIILSLAGLLVGADDPKDDAAKKEFEKLQGVWTVTKAEADGMPIKELTGQKLTFKAGRIELFGDATKKSEVKLDPDKKPCHIDIIPDKDTAKGVPTMQGIYELNGDTLKIGMPTGKSTEKIDPKTGKTIEKKEEPPGKRPAGFDDKDIVVLTLKRDTK
jgi:uncharacterized protein (TIGR03067 family)